MTSAVDGARAYARDNGARFLDELFEMLRIPSVGADPAFAADMRRNAEWLAAHLAALGLDKACVMETAGYPVVYGEWLGAGPDKPTVLVYGHYYVVPAEMADGWDSDPFEPVVKDGLLYGRGAADMKSGLAAMVTAAERFLARHPDHKGTLAFLLTSDEEGAAVDGTRRVMQLLESRGERSTGAWSANPPATSRWATRSRSAGAARCRAS